jgi:hypothetical protein
VSYVGPIQSVEELGLDQSEKPALGYLPEGFESAAIGQSDATMIAGGDVRIFRVRVAESGVTELPVAQPPPPPRGRLLTLRSPLPLEEQILSRPTFFEHFDGVVIDWQYLSTRAPAQLAREAGWLARQKVRIVVDFTSGLNGFPDLRLVNNLDSAYEKTLATFRDVFAKMPALGSRDAILSLSIGAENADTWKEYDRSLSTLCEAARAHGLTLHLRNALGRPGQITQLGSLADRIGATNLNLAPATGAILDNSFLSDDLAGKLKGRFEFCLVSTPRKDVAGRTWTADAPLAGSDTEEKVALWLRRFPQASVVLAAAYRDQDEEYRDAKCVEAALK